MISMVFKFSLAFVLSYLILSIDFSGKTVFEYIHSQIAPISKSIHRYIGSEFKTSLQKTTELGRKFFTSSAPPASSIEYNMDKRSKKRKMPNDHLTQEELNKEEIEALDKIIEKN